MNTNPSRKEQTMVNLVVAGAGGKMGSAILRLLAQKPWSEQFHLVGALEAPDHPMVGQTISTVTSEIPCFDHPHDLPANLHVMVSFASPEASLQHAESCYHNGRAMVIGTTGFNEMQLQKLRLLAQRVPMVQAYNMSRGMNFLISEMTRAARALGSDYVVEIFEAHHAQKKDAPSGTAIALANAFIEGMGWSPDEVKILHGRSGNTYPREEKEICIHAMRAGAIVGEHEVHIVSEGERLKLCHAAQTRDAFAAGALKAALWIADKKPGLYNMADVLGLKD